MIDCSGVCCGQIVLDLVGGIGDLIVKFFCLVGEIGKVVFVDINEFMFKMGCEKLCNIGVIGNVEYVQVNVEVLLFLDNIFDCIIILFGLCNVIDKDKVLCLMYCVLKFGGCLLVFEFLKLIIELLSKVYDVYFFYVLLCIGLLVVNDVDSYCYLVEFICMYFDQDILKVMMQDVGFESVDYYNLMVGVVVLYCGYKF